MMKRDKPLIAVLLMYPMLSCFLSFSQKISEEHTDEHNSTGCGGRRKRETEYLTPKNAEQTLITQVLSGYDWRVRPRGTNMSVKGTQGPVLVRVNIYLRSISKIDDVNMEYSAQFTFREEWKDSRLAYERFVNQHKKLELNRNDYGYDEEEEEDAQPPPKFLVLTTTDSKQKIWMPDTFFQNEKDAKKHDIDKPNVLIRIHPDGSILYSVRLSLVLSCPMSLEFYPLDRQTCLIDLSSYAYTTDDIEYVWKSELPVQLKTGLRDSLPSFELQDVKTKYCTSKTNTGEYSCLRTEIILRREFSYYLLQLYIPSFMLVIVSWVSFWLDKDSVPARVTLGVTTLLTMTTQSSGINANLPPVSYTKAIDVWIGVCLAFIFGALLEFALVNYAARRDIMEKAHLRSRGARTHIAEEGLLDHHEGTATFAMNPLLTNQSPLRNGQQQYYTLNSHTIVAQKPRNRRKTRGFAFAWLSKYKERSKRIDVVSRLVFPLGFFVFNCVYWTVYML